MATSLIQTIQDDFSQAMKTRDITRLETLRLVKSAIHNREIEKKGKTHGGESALTESEALEVVIREVKKRMEANEIYASAGRPELAEKELAELAILKKYLPEEASDEEVERAVKDSFRHFPEATEKDFGKIMGLVMKALKGRVDSERVGVRIRTKFLK